MYILATVVSWNIYVQNRRAFARGVPDHERCVIASIRSFFKQYARLWEWDLHFINKAAVFLNQDIKLLNTFKTNV